GREVDDREYPCVQREGGPRAEIYGRSQPPAHGDRDWASPSKGMASLAFPGGASPGFSGTRARSSLVVGPATWNLALKRQPHGFPSGQQRPANARGSLHREA
ncbi:hypothetical protein E2I00_013616, partial [Balaenoptera physalus]